MTENGHDKAEKESGEPKNKMPRVGAVTLTKLAWTLQMSAAKVVPDERARFEFAYRQILLAQEVIDKIGLLNSEHITRFVEKGIRVDELLAVPPKVRTFAEAARELYTTDSVKRLEGLIKKDFLKFLNSEPDPLPSPADQMADTRISVLKASTFSEKEFNHWKEERDKERARRGRDNRMKGLRKATKRRK